MSCSRLSCPLANDCQVPMHGGGVDVVCRRLGKCRADQLDQTLQVHQAAPDQKNDVIDVGVKATVQLAECDHIGIDDGNVDYSIPGNEDVPRLRIWRERHET